MSVYYVIHQLVWLSFKIRQPVPGCSISILSLLKVKVDENLWKKKDKFYQIQQPFWKNGQHFRREARVTNLRQSWDDNNEPPRDKTNNVAVRPAKTQISLRIRPVWSVFAVRMKKAWVLSYPLSAQRRLWSDGVDAQADLSLCWVHSHFVGFVTRPLNYVLLSTSLSQNPLFRKIFLDNFLDQSVNTSTVNLLRNKYNILRYWTVLLAW